LAVSEKSLFLQRKRSTNLLYDNAMRYETDQQQDNQFNGSEILYIKHPDFDLSIDGSYKSLLPRIKALSARGVHNSLFIGKSASQAFVRVLSDKPQWKEVKGNDATPPFFICGITYNFFVMYNVPLINPHITISGGYDEERFVCHQWPNWFGGFINFGDKPGRRSITLTYSTSDDPQRKNFSFVFHVFEDIKSRTIVAIDSKGEAVIAKTYEPMLHPKCALS